MTMTGNYFYSKYKNSGCSKIGRSPRFSDDISAFPGPGKYNDKMNMNKSGIYFNSKISSKNVKSFQGTPRISK
jgi:hypothetical protein